MNNKNVVIYEIGTTSDGYTVEARRFHFDDDFGRPIVKYAVRSSNGGRFLMDNGRMTLGIGFKTFDTLPEAVEAGKQYLLANGGEVYTDGKEGLVYIKELEGECEAKDKRIEELSSVLARLFAYVAVILSWVPAKGLDGQPKEFRDAYNALEVKQ